MNFEASDSEYGASSDELNGALGDPEPDPLDDDNDLLPFEVPSEKLHTRQRETTYIREPRSYVEYYDGKVFVREEGDDNDEVKSEVVRSESSSPSSQSRIETFSPSTQSPTHRVFNSSARTRKTSKSSGRGLLLLDYASHLDLDLGSPSALENNDDPATLRRKLRDLQAELEAVQATRGAPTPQAVPVYKSQVFHCILDESDASSSLQKICLEEPQWQILPGSFQPALDAHLPIRNLEFYLQQHPEIAFAFYKEYDNRPPRDVAKIETKDGVLRKAEPFHEKLELIAEHMIEAVEDFVSHVPDFDRLFPDFSARRTIHAPYLFAYHSAVYVADVCPKLEPLHAVWIKTLMRDIEAGYGKQHAQADIKAKQGLVTKELMPYLVKPGDILVKLDGLHTTAFKATSWLGECYSTEAEETEEHKIEGWEHPRGTRKQTRNQENLTKKIRHRFKVEMWSFLFDGVFQKTRAAKEDAAIDLVAVYEDDELQINSLNLFPLKYASMKTRESLGRRGEMFWKCRRRHLVTYHHDSDTHLSNVTDRYMVDIVSCRKLFPKLFFNKRLEDDLGRSIMNQEAPPGHDESLLFPPTIVGYNLRAKKCRTLYVDRMQDVAWNKLAFEHLVIEPQAKELVQALVTNQLESELTTDPISGKGGGLILLLHGGPGTGKTFTAEGVAEYAEKPLLRVTCGDVGIEARQVEKYLQRCFRLGKIWDCVVLLDEADVFLEERDVKDLNRNALVSVFLRMLEYYQGILILTSNRVGTFDEAFKSRIQLALHYEKLNEPQRRKIWRNFVERLRNMDNSNIDSDDILDNIEELGKADMNGREIRNVITTARQLAKYKSQKLVFMHLKHAIEVGGRFTKYLKDLNEGESDDQMKKAAGIR